MSRRSLEPEEDNFDAALHAPRAKRAVPATAAPTFSAVPAAQDGGSSPLSDFLFGSPISLLLLLLLSPFHDVAGRETLSATWVKSSGTARGSPRERVEMGQMAFAAGASAKPWTTPSRYERDANLDTYGQCNRACQRVVFWSVRRDCSVFCNIEYVLTLRVPDASATSYSRACQNS